MRTRKRILSGTMALLMLLQVFFTNTTYADELYDLNDSDIIQETKDVEDEELYEAEEQEALLRSNNFNSELSGASSGSYKITQLDKMGKGKVNETYFKELKNTATKDEEVDKKSNYAYALSINVDGDEHQAMCLSYGKKAGKNGATFESISTPTEIQGREMYTKGAVYAYEFLIGNSYLTNTIGLAPGYGEKISETEARIAFQIATWRISAGKWDNATSENSDASKVTSMVCNICDVTSANKQVERIVAAYKWLKINGIYANSGNYPGTYKKVSLFFYRPSDATWQDLMSWKVNKPEKYVAGIKKNGKITDLPARDGAQYTAYLERACKNAVQTVSTSSDGKLYFNLSQGVYYVKESKAPEGYKISDKVYDLNVTKDYSAITVTDEEEFFKIKLNKYDSATKKLLSGAKFEIQEPNNGKWVKVGELKDCGNGTYTTDGMTYKCHGLDGKEGNAVTDKLPYTGANKGKYKIVEVSAPKGYEVSYSKTIEYSDIKSQLKNGYLSFTTFETGVQEKPSTGKVKIAKYDSVTGDKLKGAVIDVYEFNAKKNSYLHIGTLGESGSIYTSAGKTFVIHDNDGNDSKQRTKGDLNYTTANEGCFMLKETTAPKHYVINRDDKVYFKLSDKKDSSGYIDLTAYASSFKDTKTASVKLYKVNKLTKETLKTAEFTISEWSKTKNKYLEIGKLKYSNSGYYELDKVTHYKDGSNKTSQTSMLHYTSENLGKFLVEETKTPEGFRGSFRKFFSINDIADGGCYELSTQKDPVVNTPLKATVKVAKYDNVTKKKLAGAEFILYEYNGSGWTQITKLLNNGDGTYSLSGLNNQYKSDGKTVLLKSDTEGYVYYTDVNKGKFKIVETKAPSGYKLDDYEKEFSINLSGNNKQSFDYTDYKYAAKDTPLTVGISVEKKDADNGELLKGAVFNLEEYSIKSSNYKKIGQLADLGNGTYSLAGVSYKQRDGITRNSEIKKTNDNAGKFRIVEVTAPLGYKLPADNITYVDISKDEGMNTLVEHEKITILNSTVKGTFSINKVDSTDVNKKLEGAEFKLFEYNTENGQYAECDYLKIVYDAQKKLYYPTYIAGSKYSDKDENGIAFLHATSKNNGKFYIIESETPDEYMSDKDLDGNDLKYYVQLTSDTSISTGYCKKDDMFYIQDKDTGSLSHSETGIFSKVIINRPLEVQITIIKKDETGLNKANGEATLKGAEYALVPAENIMINGQLVKQSFENLLGYSKLSELVENMKVCEAVINNTDGTASDLDISAAKTKLAALKNTIKDRAVATAVTGGDELHPTEDGRAIFTNVIPGKYLICEIKTPEGYLLDSDIKSITVGEGNKVNGYAYTVNVTENVIKHSYEFKKVDTNNTPLSGASFDVYNVKDLEGFKDNSSDEIMKLSDTVIKSKIINTYKAGAGINQYDFSSISPAVVNAKSTDKDVINGNLEPTGNDKEYRVKTIVSDANGMVRTPELPYGTYVIYETRTPEDKYNRIDLIILKVNKDGISVKNTGDWEIDNTKRVVTSLGDKADTELELRLKIVKKDVDTERPILGSKTTYKISKKVSNAGIESYKPLTQTYVEDNGQLVTTSNFKTDINGVLRFNQNFGVGEYLLEEVEAPDGHLLAGVEGYFNPATGKIESTPQQAIHFNISSDSVLSYDETTNTYYYEVSQYDKAAKGMLSVYKTGEQLVDSEKKAVKFNKNDYKGLVDSVEYTKTRFRFEEKPLKDVVFEVSVEEDIMAEDGQNGFASFVNSEGETIILSKYAVVDHITTGEDGFARLENLPLGKYSVREISTIDGFVKKSEPQIVEVVKSYDAEGNLLPVTVANISVKNDRQKYKCSLKKISQTAEIISGAVYGLFASEDIINANGEVLVSTDELIDVKVSDNNGMIEFDEDIPCAAYYVQELQAPEGYTLSTATSDILFNKNQTEPILYVSKQVVDDSREGKIRIFKSDSVTGDNLEGVEFTISLNGEVLQTLVTDEEGYAESDYLKMYNNKMTPYEYTLKETKSLDGYVNDDFTQNFTITDADEEDYDEDGKVFRYAEINVANKPIQVSISKKSITTGVDIPGAVLSITNAQGELVERWESDGEEHIIKKLVPGNYVLTEESAPFGYAVADSVSFTVNNVGEIQKVEMFDSPVYGKLELTKIDSKTKSKLMDAEFELRDENNKVLEKLVTDSDGFASSKEYPVGTYNSDGTFNKLITYKLVEVKAPDGYVVKNTNMDFTFDYVEGQKTVTKELTVGNDSTIVKVSKKSFTTGAELKGAKLSIYDSSNKLVESWVTDGKEHEITKLKTGKYVLTEEYAPFGYTIADSVKFTVYGQGEIQTVTMYDKPIYGNVEIVKTDADTSKPLSDAVFQIQDSNGNPLENLVTNEKGRAVSSSYPVGTYNPDGSFGNIITYRLVEIKAPKGYSIDKTVRNLKFEGKDKGSDLETKYIDVTNKRNTVKISKKSVTTGKNIKGAVLTIYNSKGAKVAQWVSSTKPHVIRGLASGVYKLVEERAPFGYTVAESVEFEIKNNTVVKKVVMYDKEIYGRLKIKKIDETTDKPLANVEFKIKNKNGKVLQTLVTDNNGRAESKKLPMAVYNSDGSFSSKITYVLEESKALNGYAVMSEDIDFEFEYTEGEKEAHKTLVIGNKPGTVLISKKSVSTGKDIKGATLTIYNKDNVLIDTWVSNGTAHKISGLKAGNYTLVEERAPFGYKIAEKVEFKVGRNYEIKKVVMYDDEVYGKIKVIKKDSITGALLNGARFELRDESGNLLEVLVTDSKGVAESKLYPAATYNSDGSYANLCKYSLVETVAPNGYIISNELSTVKFDLVDNENKDIISSITVLNKPYKETPPKTGDYVKFGVIATFIISASVFVILGCRKKEEEEE